MNPSAKPSNPAERLMTVEVISELLVSTEPSQLGKTLAEQLRELTGARTVLLIAHPEKAGPHELIHASPSRRATLFSPAEIDLFCPICTPDPLARQPADLPPDHPLREPLMRVKVESFLRFPLRASGGLDGSLLLLDLPNLDRIEETTQIVTYLLPVMSLALRNAFTRDRIEKRSQELAAQARDLERRVAERTAALDAANKNLVDSRLAALNMMEDAVEAQRRTAEASVSLQREVEERRRAEESIRQEKNFTQAAINSLPGLFYLIDDQGRFLRWNQNFEHVSGYSAEEITRITPLDLFDDPDKAKIAEAIQRVFQTVEATVEADFRSKDGTKTPFFFTGKRFQFGHKRSLVGMGIDISKRKQAEQEIQVLNAELEQRVEQRTAELATANKELESFAYSVSHDLRAPLRGIDGWSLALLEDYGEKLDDQGKIYLDTVRSETQRMGHLIDALLELSRLGRREMRREPVDLSQIAQSLIAELRQSDPKREVECVVAPALTAAGDPVLLRAVLQNLLGNAWKFTGKTSHARIEFGLMEVKGQPTFFVRDNGAGFDMAFAEKLFAPFQRLHHQQEFPGTGVGLATVQRIISRHGGSVWAESRVGQGATFYFRL